MKGGYEGHSFFGNEKSTGHKTKVEDIPVDKLELVVLLI